MSGPLAGVVTLVGRPNAGKSTVMNRLLAEKVAIVSDKPQTTRQRLVGILTEARGQMVFYDTPGLHKPEHRMNRFMVREAVDALDAADVVCLVVDASVGAGGGDQRLIDQVRRSTRPKVVLLNKIDLVRKGRLLPIIDHYAQTAIFEEIVPVSALTGDGMERVLDLLFARLPEGDPLYDADLLTPHSERFLVAERIREKVLEQTRDELPFVTAVAVERWEEDAEAGRLVIYAVILVERPGQKAILIGRGGHQIRDIGIAARRDLEEFLGRPLRLELHVRQAERWREDPQALADLDRDRFAI